MKTVHKYELVLHDDVSILMPSGAKVLHVNVQHGKVCLWAAVDSTYPLESRRFFLVGTGQAIPEDAKEYLGTVMLRGGDFVLHVYEAG